MVPDVWDQIEQGVDQAELAAVFARLSGPTAKGRAAALSDAAGMLTQAAGRVFGLVNPVAGAILDLAAGLHRGRSVEQQVSTALSRGSALPLHQDARRDLPPACVHTR